MLGRVGRVGFVKCVDVVIVPLMLQFQMNWTTLRGLFFAYDARAPVRFELLCERVGPTNLYLFDMISVPGLLNELFGDVD